MKQLSLILITCLLAFSSCNDEPAVINEDLVQTYTGRRVLVERFTNVGSINSPEGAEHIQDIAAQYQGYVIPVSIYTNLFSTPDESLYDFETPEGVFLENDYIGPITGYPTAAINREFFPNEYVRTVSKKNYLTHIQNELLEQPKVDINIQNNYNTASRLLTVTVQLDFLETVKDSLGISVMILEDNIIDFQLTENGKNPNYVHNHVLRKILTAFTGDVIDENQTTIGQTPKFTYTFTLPITWNEDNCSVVAFVSEQKHSLEVLQANQADL